MYRLNLHNILSAALLAASVQGAFVIECRPQFTLFKSVRTLSQEQQQALLDSCVEAVMASIDCDHTANLNNNGVSGTTTINKASFNTQIFSPSKKSGLDPVALLAGCQGVLQQCQNMGVATDDGLDAKIMMSGYVSSIAKAGGEL